MRRIKLRYEFWLEPGKLEHEQVADVIDTLKHERAFAPVVRDGIMLVAELRRGSVDLLLRLFPWVEDRIIAMQPPQEIPTNAEVAALRAELELMKAWMASSPMPIEQGRAPLPSLPPAAAADDELLTIRKAEGEGKASAENFLASAFGLLG